MADRAFEDPRLAALYDTIDADRSDLDHYVAIAHELGFGSMLDVGCGTGILARRLAAGGLDVHGLDPARAMLDVARSRPGSHTVSWHQGTLSGDYPAVEVDGVTMTGNVAQVFLTDDSWSEVLESTAAHLRPGGHLVFETRVPERRAWEGWTKAKTFKQLDDPEVGPLAARVDVTAVDLPLITFESWVRFGNDDVALRSESTLRFRSRDELDRSLDGVGFDVVDVRDAPDRPDLEFVYLARRR